MDLLFADPPRGGSWSSRTLRNDAVHALNAAVGFVVDGRVRPARQGGPAQLLHARATIGGGDDDVTHAGARRPPRPRSGWRPRTGTWCARRSPSSRTSGCSGPQRRRRRLVLRWAADDAAVRVPVPRPPLPLDHWRRRPGRHPDAVATATGDRARCAAARARPARRLWRRRRRHCRSTSRRSPAPCPAAAYKRESRRARRRASWSTPASRRSRPRWPRGTRASSPTTGGWASTPATTCAYAPEAGAPSGWCGWRCVRDLRPSPRSAGSTTRTLLARRAGRRDRTGSSGRLARPRAWTPDDYRLMPVHPWQWDNKLAITFAADVARRRHRLPRRAEPTTTWRSSRCAPSSTHSRPRPALREDRAVGAQHGLHARPLGRLHGGHARRSTTGSPTWSTATDASRRSGFSVLREVAAIGYHHALVRGESPQGVGVPEDAVGAVAREPGAAAAPTASGWRRWPRCCTSTRRARRWSRSWSRASRLHAGRLAAALPRRLPGAGAALLLRARPGLHAARREPHPGAARPRAWPGRS